MFSFNKPQSKAVRQEPVCTESLTVLPTRGRLSDPPATLLPKTLMSWMIFLSKSLSHI